MLIWSSFHTSFDYIYVYLRCKLLKNSEHISYLFICYDAFLKIGY